MTFKEAMEEALKGKWIRSEHWTNQACYIRFNSSGIFEYVELNRGVFTSQSVSIGENSMKANWTAIDPPKTPEEILLEGINEARKETSVGSYINFVLTQTLMRYEKAKEKLNDTTKR